MSFFYLYNQFTNSDITLKLYHIIKVIRFPFIESKRILKIFSIFMFNIYKNLKYILNIPSNSLKGKSER